MAVHYSNEGSLLGDDRKLSGQSTLQRDVDHGPGFETREEGGESLATEGHQQGLTLDSSLAVQWTLLSCFWGQISVSNAIKLHTGGENTSVKLSASTGVGFGKVGGGDWAVSLALAPLF